MTDDTSGWDRANEVLEQRRQNGECGHCESNDNLTAEMVHGDPKTARIDWICKKCRERGFEIK